MGSIKKKGEGTGYLRGRNLGEGTYMFSYMGMCRQNNGPFFLKPQNMGSIFHDKNP